jgi:hypothetical protein
MPTPIETIDSISGSLASVQLQLDGLRRQVAGPIPEPPKPPAVRHSNGIFLLDPGEENRSYSAADLRLEAVTGGTIRFRRPWVMKEGGFDWSFIDQYVDMHSSAGKPYTLLCMGGDHPKPWLSENIVPYMELMEAAAERYLDDRLLVGWHITGCSPQGVSEELHWENGKFTDEILGACQSLTKEAARYFHRCDILQALSGKDRSGRIEKLVEYGASVAPGRYLVKSNAAKAIEIDAWHNQRVVNSAKDARVRYGSEPAGSYYYESARMGPGTVNDMINQSREMARRAGKNPADAYVAIYWPDRHAVDWTKFK